VRYVCTDPAPSLHPRLGLLEPGKAYEYEDDANIQAAEGCASLRRVGDDPMAHESSDADDAYAPASDERPEPDDTPEPNDSPPLDDEPEPDDTPAPDDEPPADRSAP
jgi:hypothetical protein